MAAPPRPQRSIGLYVPVGMPVLPGQQPIPVPPPPGMAAMVGNRSAPKRKPGLHQTAYVAGGGPVPNEVGDLGGLPGGQNVVPSVTSWRKMTRRMQQMPYNSAPLAMLWDVKVGRLLPTFIYTRPTVNLVGSFVPYNQAPCGFQARGNRFIQGIEPVTMKARNTPDDKLKNFFFVPARPKTVQNFGLQDVPSQIPNNPRSFNAEVFLGQASTCVETALVCVLNHTKFVSGCWWQDVHQLPQLDPLLLQALQQYQTGATVADHITLTDLTTDLARHLGSALHRGFTNSFGRDAIVALLEAVKFCVEQAVHLGHEVFIPDVDIENDTAVVQSSYCTTNMKPEHMCQLFLEGTGRLPFHITQQNAPHVAGAGPPPRDPVSFERLRVIRKILTCDYWENCPFDFPLKCAVPNAPKIVDAAVVCRERIFMDQASKGVTWNITVNPVFTEVKPIAVEVVGKKDTWGTVEAFKGAVIAAMEALAYQDRSYIVLVYDTSAHVIQCRRTENHEIVTVQRIFNTTGDGTAGSVQAEWQAFYRCLVNVYIDAIYEQKRRRWQNCINQVQNNCFFHQRAGQRGVAAAQAHDPAVIHCDLGGQNPPIRPDICCHIEDFATLDDYRQRMGCFPVDK